MNQNCPSCGALYNVADKDVGRRLKCKKCNAALKVTDKGLEEDRGTTNDSKPVPIPAADRDDRDRADGDRADEPSPRKRKRDRDERTGPGLFTQLVTQIGGISTILFGLGVFFVILFTFMTEIGAAATVRADAAKKKLEAEKALELRDLLPKGKTDETQLNADERKVYDNKKKDVENRYDPPIARADDEAKLTRANNDRAVWMERYGLMFGFMFVAFGCVGYLRTAQPLVLQIVAAVILSFMMMVVFFSFGGGCGGPKLPQSRTQAVPDPKAP
jgi:predicted Zn finger-like uncharacterized protein